MRTKWSFWRRLAALVWTRWAPGWVCGLVVALPVLLADAGAQDLAFHAGRDGGFGFDTGTLRGRLRVGGKSLGLQEVVHSPSGLRLDRSNGLLSHYRVFSQGKRYGAGAWDWPSRAELTERGTVRVVWSPAPGRPFELRASYRICDRSTIELETAVRAEAGLPAFEVFVASYFSESFTNAALGLVTPGGPEGTGGRWIAARRDRGDWQMFPRDGEVLPLIRDGRWKMEPNPVDWTIREGFGTSAVALRRSVPGGLSGVLMSRAADCFAIAMPHETEGHRSVYFSLIGREVKAGETVETRVRLSFVGGDSEAWRSYSDTRKEWLEEPRGVEGGKAL